LNEDAAKEFSKLDRATQRKIQRYIAQRIEPADDPRVFAKPLLISPTVFPEMDAICWALQYQGDLPSLAALSSRPDYRNSF